MKNKLGKKLLVGGACACLLLTGGLTLSGCSLSDEQQKALDVLVQNTETLVTDFGSYLDGQNAKIDKEKAADMIEKSRLNFLMSNFNNLEMSFNMKLYDGYEDKLMFDPQARSCYYKAENGVKTIAGLEDERVVSMTKSDFNNDVHYYWNGYNEDEVMFKELEYTSGMWSMYSSDIFSQSPLSYVGEITPDDIYNITVVEGGYEFEIIANVSDITETDLSKYEEDAEANIFNILMKIEIKNDYITKVNFKGVQTIVPVTDLMTEMTGENSTIILDENGMPTIDSYDNAQVITNIINVEYKYENIDYSLVEEKIAEIEATYLTQE